MSVRWCLDKCPCHHHRIHHLYRPHHIDTSQPLVFGSIGESVLKGLEGHWQTQPTQFAVKNEIWD